MIPEPPLVRLGAVESTQTVAFALAAAGAPHRTVVVADTQRQGRGRHGRVWYDEPGQSLLMSVLLRPRVPPIVLPGLSLVGAVAVADALEHVAGLAPRLKWPNDVLLNGRKVAGVLLESRLESAPVVVLGIGLNLGPRAIPEGLAANATSVTLAGGRPLEREVALVAVLHALDRWLEQWSAQGLEPVRARWRVLADTLGRTIAVDGLHGVAVDVDADGALLVLGADGIRRVVAGEVMVQSEDAARH